MYYFALMAIVEDGIFSSGFLKFKVCDIPEDSCRRVKPQINSIRLWGDIVVARFAKYSPIRWQKNSQALEGWCDKETSQTLQISWRLINLYCFSCVWLFQVQGCLS